MKPQKLCARQKIASPASATTRPDTRSLICHDRLQDARDRAVDDTVPSPRDPDARRQAGADNPRPAMGQDHLKGFWQRGPGRPQPADAGGPADPERYPGHGRRPGQAPECHRRRFRHMPACPFGKGRARQRHHSRQPENSAEEQALLLTLPRIPVLTRSMTRPCRRLLSAPLHPVSSTRICTWYAGIRW